MRSMRFGLQARFLAAVAIMLAVVLALLGTLLHRDNIPVRPHLRDTVRR